MAAIPNVDPVIIMDNVMHSLVENVTTIEQRITVPYAHGDEEYVDGEISNGVEDINKKIEKINITNNTIKIIIQQINKPVALESIYMYDTFQNGLNYTVELLGLNGENVLYRPEIGHIAKLVNLILPATSINTDYNFIEKGQELINSFIRDKIRLEYNKSLFEYKFFSPYQLDIGPLSGLWELYFNIMYSFRLTTDALHTIIPVAGWDGMNNTINNICMATPEICTLNAVDSNRPGSCIKGNYPVAGLDIPAGWQDFVKMPKSLTDSLIAIVQHRRTVQMHNNAIVLFDIGIPLNNTIPAVTNNFLNNVNGMTNDISPAILAIPGLLPNSPRGICYANSAAITLTNQAVISNRFRTLYDVVYSQYDGLQKYTPSGVGVAGAQYNADNIGTINTVTGPYGLPRGMIETNAGNYQYCAEQNGGSGAGNNANLDGTGIVYSGGVGLVAGGSMNTLFFNGIINSGKVYGNANGNYASACGGAGAAAAIKYQPYTAHHAVYTSQNDVGRMAYAITHTSANGNVPGLKPAANQGNGNFANLPVAQHTGEIAGGLAVTNVNVCAGMNFNNGLAGGAVDLTPHFVTGIISPLNGVNPAVIDHVVNCLIKTLRSTTIFRADQAKELLILKQLSNKLKIGLKMIHKFLFDTHNTHDVKPYYTDIFGNATVEQYRSKLFSNINDDNAFYLNNNGTMSGLPVAGTADITNTSQIASSPKFVDAFRRELLYTIRGFNNAVHATDATARIPNIDAEYNVFNNINDNRLSGFLGAGVDGNAGRNYQILTVPNWKRILDSFTSIGIDGHANSYNLGSDLTNSLTTKVLTGNIYAPTPNNSNEFMVAGITSINKDEIVKTLTRISLYYNRSVKENMEKQKKRLLNYKSTQITIQQELEEKDEDIKRGHIREMIEGLYESLIGTYFSNDDKNDMLEGIEGIWELEYKTIQTIYVSDLSLLKENLKQERNQKVEKEQKIRDLQLTIKKFGQTHATTQAFRDIKDQATQFTKDYIKKLKEVNADVERQLRYIALYISELNIKIKEITEKKKLISRKNPEIVQNTLSKLNKLKEDMQNELIKNVDINMYNKIIAISKKVRGEKLKWNMLNKESKQKIGKHLTEIIEKYTYNTFTTSGIYMITYEKTNSVYNNGLYLYNLLTGYLIRFNKCPHLNDLIKDLKDKSKGMIREFNGKCLIKYSDNTPTTDFIGNDLRILEWKHIENIIGKREGVIKQNKAGVVLIKPLEDSKYKILSLLEDIISERTFEEYTKPLSEIENIWKPNISSNAKIIGSLMGSEDVSPILTVLSYINNNPITGAANDFTNVSYQRLLTHIGTNINNIATTRYHDQDNDTLVSNCLSLVELSENIVAGAKNYEYISGGSKNKIKTRIIGKKGKSGKGNKKTKHVVIKMKKEKQKRSKFVTELLKYYK